VPLVSWNRRTNVPDPTTASRDTIKKLLGPSKRKPAKKTARKPAAKKTAKKKTARRTAKRK
jgi:hypothetical protein